MSANYFYSSDEIISGAERWLSSKPDERDRFQYFVKHSKISKRSFAIPLEKVLSLGGSEERARIFLEVGAELGTRALQKALTGSGIPRAELDGLIYTSCSVPAIPSLDVRIIAQAGLAPTIRRYPFFQYGCAGGASGLAFARELAANGKRVALLSVELCSLLYHAEDISSGNLLGSALFGDGAACAVIEPAGSGLQLLASKSLLIPETEHLMGYDIRDDGMHLRLDRDLPSRLSKVAPELIHGFLADNGLTTDQVAHWLFHPGGAKILQALEKDFSLNRSQTAWSWEVLEDFGNMSSASILYVLEAYLRDRAAKSDSYGLLVGIGPGLSVELMLFRDSSSSAL